jgi:hypothetical protein
MNYKEWLIAAVFSHVGEIVISDLYWKEQKGKWKLKRRNLKGEVILNVIPRVQKIKKGKMEIET